MEKKVCAICGKEAKYMSAVNISPLCRDCAEKQVKKIWSDLGRNDVEHMELDDFYAKICDNIVEDKAEEFKFDLGEEY